MEINETTVAENKNEKVKPDPNIKADVSFEDGFESIRSVFDMAAKLTQNKYPRSISQIYSLDEEGNVVYKDEKINLQSTSFGILFDEVKKTECYQKMFSQEIKDFFSEITSEFFRNGKIFDMNKQIDTLKDNFLKKNNSEKILSLIEKAFSEYEPYIKNTKLEAIFNKNDQVQFKTSDLIKNIFVYIFNLLNMVQIDLELEV